MESQTQIFLPMSAVWTPLDRSVKIRSSTTFWGGLNYRSHPILSIVSERELAARIRELSEQLKRTTSSAEALASQVAEAIRQERRAGLPYIPPKTDSQTGDH
jgi:adenosylmethionine-8-amino-7-oxononanoate aminotransferase